MVDVMCGIVELSLFSLHQLFMFEIDISFIVGRAKSCLVHFCVRYELIVSLMRMDQITVSRHAPFPLMLHVILLIDCL